MNLYDQLLSGQAKLSLIGLGYVGLPIAIAFARKVQVIGFDLNERKIQEYLEGRDPTREVGDQAVKDSSMVFTADPARLKEALFHIVAVPTPVRSDHTPDLRPLEGASRLLGRHLQPGSVVVFESTVYPGVTEEVCVPILEKESGLVCGKDFKVGYSPERINPGDQLHRLENIVKVVSGMDGQSLDLIARVYELVVEAGVFRARNIKVAEAAKVIENSQRDINIAFMNELSIIFNRMGINTYEVLEAAGTKWNFLKFYPGLVGGHCIGVDPYYLSYKAKAMGYHPQMIDSGRFTNDSMGAYAGKETVKKLIAARKSPDRSRVLIMGMTFKEDVTDIRNSKVIDVVNELRDFGVEVDVIDPGASQAEVKAEYGIDLKKGPERKYDAIIVAVAHKEYRNLDEKFFLDLLNEKGILVDLKGMYRNRMKWLTYWSL